MRYQGSINFLNGNGTLRVTSGSGPGTNSFSSNSAAIISGFQTGDSIESDITLAQSGWKYNNHVLQITSNGQVAVSFYFAGNYSQSDFLVEQPGNGAVGYTYIQVNSTANVLPSHLAFSPVPTNAFEDPTFDVSYYLAHNPDVAAAGLDPYQQYITEGWKAGRNPSAGFDVRDYLAANPDVRAAGVNPSLQYDLTGKAEGRAAFAVTGRPDPGVDATYYYAINVDVKSAGVDASAHYEQFGWREGRNPDAFFDTNFYLTQNPDVKAAGIDPLKHYEQYGWKEGRDPSLLFSTSKYLAANPDVKAAGLDPLLHYLDFGQTEGRMAFLAGGTAGADPLVNAAFYDKQLGATLTPAGMAAQQQAAFNYAVSGWQAERNPDALFNTAYYLSHNPDVAAAHVNPLTQYEQFGWKEGRDPSAQFSTNKYLAANPDVRAAGVDPLLHYVVFGQAEGRPAFAV